MGCKLTAIAMLEALSSGLGLDVSLSMMMGELPNRVPQAVRLESFFPEVQKPYKPQIGLETEVLNSLENGRAKSNRHLQNSNIMW